jgi:transposase
MPGKAAKVVITERQQKVLQEFGRSRSEPAMLIQRAKIILAAFAGRSNEEIAEEVGLNRMQVGVWRRRWRDGWDELCRFECLETGKLRSAIREMLSDAHRSGSPGKFTAEQVCRILAVACEPPSQSGRPITHWTRDELRDEVIKRGIVEDISASQISRYLREAALQPHRQKMWINTKEKDPEVFRQQVEAVCDTYLEAPQRFEEDGTRTVSCDEMTGIQALERGAPDQPMQPDQPARQEFEYGRHGTTTLICNWDVVQGVTFCETIGPTRTEEDFVAHIEQTVASDPEVTWVFVLDQLNIHMSAGLVEWVAKECEPDRPLGKKRQRGNLEKQGFAF